MKKIISTLLITTGILSAQNISSLGIGSTQNDFGIGTNSSSGMNFHGDIMPSGSVFGAGIGFDANIFNTDLLTPKNLQSAYTMGAVGKIGIKLDSIGLPANLKLGAGYAVIDIGNTDIYGPQYEISLDLKIFGNYGTGIKYKEIKAEHQGNNIDLKTGTVYFVLSSF